ncbi:hypothetical protein SC1_02269 [Sphingopyxis sp. C-1]|nr:hypothetical protein SC1_02269 [Sphingopyxis sp. C-1]
MNLWIVSPILERRAGSERLQRCGGGGRARRRRKVSFSANQLH